MGEELTRSLNLLAERGTPRGAERVLEDARRVATRGPAQDGPTWRRGLVVALAAATAVLVFAGIMLLIVHPFGGEEIPPVTEPPVVTTTPPVVTTTLPEPVALLSGEVSVGTSGGFLWAWWETHEPGVGTTDRVWRYGSDGWESLPTPPGDVGQVAYGGGILWASIGNSNGVADLYHLDGNDWVPLNDWVPGTSSPSSVSSMAVDPTSGILWFVADDLYRWDGKELTDVGQPDSEATDEATPFFYLGEINVTRDGTVWAGGLDGWSPERGTLASYRDGPQGWETVTPWDGNPVPAAALAPTPDGGLWALLEDWDRGPNIDETTFKGWALAHRDGATGEWTVFDTGLPDLFPGTIAADDDAVWVAEGYVGGGGPYASDVGMYRFDGTSWTHYLEGIRVLEIAVAPDGTVWYSGGEESQLHRLDQ